MQSNMLRNFGLDSRNSCSQSIAGDRLLAGNILLGSFGGANNPPCFVYMRRLLTNIRGLAEICRLVSVLNSQTPRLTRRILHALVRAWLAQKSANLTIAS